MSIFFFRGDKLMSEIYGFDAFSPKEIALSILAEVVMILRGAPEAQAPNAS